MQRKKNKMLIVDGETVISRADYQEILLAKLAGGDNYANETLQKIRRIDRLLDKIREKPIYK